MSSFLKKIVAYWPHAAIIAAFAILSAVYFLPVLQGKQLPQMDNTHAIGAAQELRAYEQQTGERAQWTDSMFGGMPAYQIKGDNSSNIFGHFNAISRLGLPYTTIAIVFLYMVGFYLLMVSMKMNRWVAVAGAIAFAFGSYNFIIIIAGHITKAYAIALMPAVVGGFLLTFNSNKFVGGLYTAIALGMEVAYNHVQITYYLALALLLLVISKLIYAIKDKQVPDFMQRLGVLAVACILAIIPALTNLWTTYEYGKYSIRGASELTKAEADTVKASSGLDIDYALAWSYGIHETPTLIIPNVVGGASEPMGYNTKAVQNLDPQLRDIVAKQTSQYWGGRGFTSGPVYLGAVVCFLFFIGCFYYKGREKWWLIIATILSIMLAWGKNFMPLTEFMFYHFPLYNKFRTVEMALVIASVTVPILAMLGLKEIYDNPERIKYEMGKFFGAIGLTAGVCFLIAAVPTLFYDFVTPAEKEQFAPYLQYEPEGVYAQLYAAIVDARIELTRTDAIRSAVFILLASSALWFFSVRKIGDKYAMMTLIALILIDMWSIDRRYISSEDFVQKRNARNFVMQPADKAIIDDKTPHRVMCLYTNPFNEVNTSYYHHSIGGYHGAKLRRYQDVIDMYLAPAYMQLTQALQSQDYAGLSNIFESSEALKMLNTKYFIYNPTARPLLNPYAYGAAWFVDETVKAETPDEAIAFIGENNLRKKAIIEGVDVASAPDSTATIERTFYAPDKLEYKSKSSVDAVAVFSEIYYEAGWKAYIDDVETEILHADYILRALRVPAGEHVIRFEFKPQSFAIGKGVATAGSILIVLLIVAAIVYSVRKNNDTSKAA